MSAISWPTYCFVKTATLSLPAVGPLDVSRRRLPTPSEPAGPAAKEKVPASRVNEVHGSPAATSLGYTVTVAAAALAAGMSTHAATSAPRRRDFKRCPSLDPWRRRSAGLMPTAGLTDPMVRIASKSRRSYRFGVLTMPLFPV